MPNLSGDGDAVQAGQGHVQDDHVGPLFLRHRKHFGAVARLPAHLPAEVIFNYITNAASDDLVVVRDQYA
ncbi:hypothetical protein GCM10009101_05140 [Brevundimonas lenta]